MTFSKPVSELVRLRYSCRTCQTNPLSRNDLSSLEAFSETLLTGPSGSPLKIRLVAAVENASQELRGLGTYGFIKDPAGFLVGAVKEADRALEDLGFQLENLILKATDLGIGSCWLGGTFTKSRFARLMDLEDGEYIPAVVSLGYPADSRAWLDQLARIYAGADRRFPWETLFFQESFSNPISQSQAGPYQEPLELVRLAPSASNKQPWRIVNCGSYWHFYLQRAENYPPPVFGLLLGLADLQRIDLGIAMAHFSLAAREHSLAGHWIRLDPELPLPDPRLEYNISWKSET